MSFDILIGGQYKILIEPVAYFTYNGINMAMTATEAALYDQQVSGRLRTAMGNLTHKTCPSPFFWKPPISVFRHGAEPEQVS